MKRKKASISFVMLVSLVVLCAGAAILSVSVSGRYNAKGDYERMKNRYIGESSAELAVGLFLNYLSNQDQVMAYSKNEDGSYSVRDDFSPYLLDEIRLVENSDGVTIELVAVETADYLASIGFLDFARGNRVQVKLSTFYSKENMKLSRLCIEPGFLVSSGSEITERESKMNPIYLTVTTHYKGGEVMCNIKISDLYVVREPFYTLESDAIGSVTTNIDTRRALVVYENFQNYRRMKE